MNRVLVFALLLVIFPGSVVFADSETLLSRTPFTSLNGGTVYSHYSYIDNGYTCRLYVDILVDNGSEFSGTENIVCTKNVTAYAATPVSSFAIRGYTNTVTQSTQAYFSAWGGAVSCPIVYLYNPPNGSIKTHIDSRMDTFFPKPAFTAEGGWDVAVKDGVQTVGGEPVDHLFYELALPAITLSRHGRNFDSKEEIRTYLAESDFLTKLGFTETEKKNSLAYILSELEAAPDSPYYYLTVVDDAAVAAISTLTINPAPETLVRQYFAVYPSTVPVATVGDFVFPEQQAVDGYYVKETGELLLDDTMFVSFK